MMLVYSMLYGFAQWLESSAGYSAADAGLVTLPMSILAAVAAIAGARIRVIRTSFVIGTGACLAGSIGLFFIQGTTTPAIIAPIVMLFGLPQGLAATATQAAIYVQAPPESIGMAAGLQRTATYVGAIAATSLISALYGQQATDHGIHALAAVMGVVSFLLFVATIIDRTLPRGPIG
jgi:hypothetical protein